MTERERWVVYPLLFLALGAALRDKLVDRTVTKRIVCQELRIEDEPVGNEPARVLAIIGREPKPTGSGTGFFYLNGNMDIIDGDPSAVPPPRTLVKLGRTEPAHGASIGFVAVNGQVIVDGLINARQFAYQGNLFMPTLPGLNMPDFLRSMPASPGGQLPKKSDSKSPTSDPRSQSPEDTTGAAGDSALPNSNSDSNTTPRK